MLNSIRYFSAQARDWLPFLGSAIARGQTRPSRAPRSTECASHSFHAPSHLRPRIPERSRFLYGNLRALSRLDPACAGSPSTQLENFRFLQSEKFRFWPELCGRHVSLIAEARGSAGLYLATNS